MKYLLIILSMLMFMSCSKEEDDSSSNPFNDPSLKKPADTTTPQNLDSTSFQYLYYKVFKPTCANSGCHDGNFQPDFRTVYSSYNTLVNHEVIQNDEFQSFKYRVEPGNVAKSLINERLNRFMKNTSGVMPLAFDPESDWARDSALYKDLIADWIKRGAPDSYGNLPSASNAKPQVIGLMAFNAGNTTNPLPRGSGNQSPILIPLGNSIDVYFALTDDQTNANDFKLSQLKSSYELFDFSNAQIYTMNSGNTLQGKDFWENPVTFTHKASISFPSDTSGTYIYLRTYLQDSMQEDTTEIPNLGTNDIMRSYFTLKVDSL